MTTAAQAKPAATPSVSRWRHVFKRILTLVVMALAFGFAMHQLGAALEHDARPAGFGQGMIQGVLMPCTLPILAVGKDVSIYNPNNTGVPYKLGYTCGVNACGAVFFGVFFWRVNRWRKRFGNPASRQT